MLDNLDEENAGNRFAELKNPNSLKRNLSPPPEEVHDSRRRKLNDIGSDDAPPEGQETDPKAKSLLSLALAYGSGTGVAESNTANLGNTESGLVPGS